MWLRCARRAASADRTRLLPDISDVTPKMLGASADRKCQTKGAETSGLLLYLVNWMASDAVMSRLGAEGRILKLAAQRMAELREKISGLRLLLAERPRVLALISDELAALVRVKVGDVEDLRTATRALAEVGALLEDAQRIFSRAQHHFHEHEGGLPSPFVFLAHVAARTRRIRLGTGIVTLPLENALRVAEDAIVLGERRR